MYVSEENPGLEQPSDFIVSIKVDKDPKEKGRRWRWDWEMLQARVPVKLTTGAVEAEPRR